MLEQDWATLGVSALAGRLQPTPVAGEHPEPELIAHRGCAGENPENTIQAVETASTVADAVEVDVRRCKTGELVVLHDERLDRLTTEHGRVDQTPRDTVLGLQIGDSGETIPPLRDVFEAVPSGVNLVLDVKESGLVGDILTLHSEYDHELLLSSFHPPILEEIRTTDPAVSTAYIVRESTVNRLFRPALPGLPSWLYAPEDIPGLIEKTVALDCDAIHPRYELCLQTDLVHRAHEADIRVAPWTITTRREFDALQAVGVDAVISDICTGIRR